MTTNCDALLVDYGLTTWNWQVQIGQLRCRRGGVLACSVILKQ